jgi:hypothetical protein
MRLWDLNVGMWRGRPVNLGLGDPVERWRQTQKAVGVGLGVANAGEGLASRSDPIGQLP